MKVSEFQYANPHLTEMVFMENPNFVMNKEEVEMVRSITSNIKKLEGNHAMISVSLTLGAHEDLEDFENDQPFWLKCTVEAEFEWSEKIQNGGEINALLEKNAQFLLIGYLRPIVANITNVSKFPVYNLPFINLDE